MYHQVTLIGIALVSLTLFAMHLALMRIHSIVLGSGLGRTRVQRMKETQLVQPGESYLHQVPAKKFHTPSPLSSPFRT